MGVSRAPGRPPTSNAGWFAAIDAFDDFTGIADSAHYRSAPDDWHVIITDTEGSARAGELAYGVHRSDSALMTGLVFNLERGLHIHFVDGSDGGFTNASRGFEAALN